MIAGGTMLAVRGSILAEKITRHIELDSARAWCHAKKLKTCPGMTTMGDGVV
jgi:hypothetical protein